MPWVTILLLIGGTYLLVKLGQGLWEMIAWYRDGRDFAEEQRRARERQTQGQASHSRHSVPPLKERPNSAVMKPKPGDAKKGPMH